MTGIIVGILGVIVGIIGVILTIKSFKKKKISFLIENSTIFDKKNFVDKLKVTYDNKPLLGLSNAKILIVNNGQEAIGESDISKEEPIRIKVSENHEILNANVQHSGNNKVAITKKNNQEYVIEFEFLNPKEGIIVNFLHDGTPFNEIELLGRIKGINKFENLRVITFWEPVLGILVGILVGLSFPFASYISNYYYFYSDSIFYYPIMFLPVLLGIILLGIIFLHRKKKLTRPNHIDNLKRIMSENCT